MGGSMKRPGSTRIRVSGRFRLDPGPLHPNAKPMKRLFRLQPATVVSLVALFVALGGTGYAAIKLPANSVGTKQLKKKAVTLKKIKKSTRKRPKGQKGAPS